VLGFTAEEFSWHSPSASAGHTEAEGKQEPDRMTVAQFKISTHTIRPGESESSGNGMSYEGKAVSSRGFTPDGRWLLLVQHDGRLQLAENQFHPDWFHTEHRTLPFKNPGGKIRPLALLPDGKKALMMGESGAIGVWDLESGQEARRLEGLQEPLSSFALSRDGRKLLTSQDDSAVLLWDLEEGKRVRRFERHKDGVGGLAFSVDGTRFVSYGGDRTLRLWDVEGGQQLWQAASLKRLPTAVTFSPDGRRIAVALGHEIQIWDLPNES
jgi:WD40 repeat protein